MLFTKPCCENLQNALSQREGMIRIFSADGDPPVLFVAVHGTFEELEEQSGFGWVVQPVLFCPFCGTELQTQDSFDEWQEKNSG